MIHRIVLELDRDEKEELRNVFEKLKSDKPSVEIKLNPYLRSIARTILKEMDRWEDDRRERW